MSLLDWIFFLCAAKLILNNISEADILHGGWHLFT
jgi:hypothetical protein